MRRGHIASRSRMMPDRVAIEIYVRGRRDEFECKGRFPGERREVSRSEAQGAEGSGNQDQRTYKFFRHELAKKNLEVKVGDLLRDQEVWWRVESIPEECFGDVRIVCICSPSEPPGAV